MGRPYPRTAPSKLPLAHAQWTWLPVCIQPTGPRYLSQVAAGRGAQHQWLWVKVRCVHEYPLVAIMMKFWGRNNKIAMAVSPCLTHPMIFGDKLGSISDVEGIPLWDYPLEERWVKTLRHAFYQVKVIDGQWVQPTLCSPSPILWLLKVIIFNMYLYNIKIIYQVAQDTQTKEETTHFWVSKNHWEMLFQVAHRNPVGQHLGQDRKLSMGPWPGSHGSLLLAGYSLWCSQASLCFGPGGLCNMIPWSCGSSQHLSMECCGSTLKLSSGLGSQKKFWLIKAAHLCHAPLANYINSWGLNQFIAVFTILRPMAW